MASESKGSFIIIRPDDVMKNNTFPIAVLNISGINEEDTMEYYPIMSNFYDTVVYSGNGTTTLKDLNNNSVPPQALQYNLVNKIAYNGTIYWLSNVGGSHLKYCAIKNSTNYITISTSDAWNTYTVVFSGDNAD